MQKIDLREIRSVTDFQKNIKSCVEKLKDTSVPMVLTMNGKAELVVQNADSYQKLLNEVEEARFVAAVQKSIHEMDAGKGLDAKESLKALRTKLEK